LCLRSKESESENVPKKFKARLCGQGYRQQYGVDFNETYAPVAAYNSVRMFVSLCASMDFELDSVDVITAFLLADLKKNVKIPDGYLLINRRKAEKSYVYKRVWIKTITESLE
jgi:hypothetical protein